jgi:hypothetical protein
MDIDSDEEKNTRRSRRPIAKKPKASSKKKQKDLDDDDFWMEDQLDDDDSLEDDMIVDSEEEDMIVDSEEEDFGEKTTKQKKARATKKTASSKKPSFTNSSNSNQLDAEFQAKMARDRKSFKPNNNPQKWPKDGAYVDPVGVDPTHGIVEGIVSAQVRKVGGLLQLVKAHHEQHRDNSNDTLGELTYPIRLQVRSDSCHVSIHRPFS